MTILRQVRKEKKGDRGWNLFKFIKSKPMAARESTGLRNFNQLPPDAAEKGQAGWISPTYSESRTVHLNPLTAEENRCVAALTHSSVLESYKVLRTHILQKTACGSGKTIMVTSVREGEGKTTTAINLAFTFAREFQQTVLLVDCDFRRQQIHRLLGIDSDKGLIDHLLNGQAISDLIIWPGFEKLTFISGGRTVQDSSELLASPRMRELVHDMRNRYPDRYIFFDVPGILSGADAMAFAPLVDHMLVVVAAGSTPLPDLRRALETIPPEKMLGIVLNKFDGQ